MKVNRNPKIYSCIILILIFITNKSFSQDTLVTIYFESGSSKLMEKEKFKIKAFMKYVEKNWDIDSSLIFSIGSTEAIGSSEYKVELSRKRVYAVDNYILYEMKPKPNLPQNIGRPYNVGVYLYDLYPIASNQTIEGRAKNRRVELYFSKRGYFEWLNEWYNKPDNNKSFYEKFIKPWYGKK